MLQVYINGTKYRLQIQGVFIPVLNQHRISSQGAGQLAVTHSTWQYQNLHICMTVYQKQML